jgi:hypothetical protein
MRTGKVQLHKDRVGGEYGKKLNKAWTEVVQKKYIPRSRNTMATNEKDMRNTANDILGYE